MDWRGKQMVFWFSLAVVCALFLNSCGNQLMQDGRELRKFEFDKIAERHLHEEALSGVYRMCPYVNQQ